MPRSPMNWQRCSTENPGVLVSTMKAVICFFSFPFTIFGGVWAMTTMSSACVPLVHQSFSPLMIQPLPSGDFTAVVCIFAGSEPTPGSVRANAEMAPLAQARQVLLLLLFGAEELERLRHADGLVRRQPGHARAAPGGHQTDGAVVVGGAESEAAVLLRDLHAPGAELLESVEELARVLAGPVDLIRVHVLREEMLELLEKLVGLRLVLQRLFGEGIDQIEIELAEEEIADERRLFPLGLARRFGDLHRLHGALGLDFSHG